MSEEKTGRILRCEALLTETGWVDHAFITLDGAGNILSISPYAPEDSRLFEMLDGAVLPGFQNAHSHAFQYAMAGRAEHLPPGAGADDFWSWREAMYKLALSVSPSEVVGIATLLYAEMLRHGYTSVAEFHYLHRDVNGDAYEQEALLGACLIKAAEDVGIRLTLVPVWYKQGGFGVPAQPHQKRFLCDSLDAYLKLLDATRVEVAKSPMASLGMGIHSLRAVPPDEAKLAFVQADSSLPRHIHVAEQQQEIDAALAQMGTRPVRWLLDNLSLDHRYHLVHATHIDESEVTDLATSGANVVLCPSTEGNLGDGFFPLGAYMAGGGRWSIGTDSHVGLSPHEELRLLDYGQRLLHQKRNILCQKSGEDSAHIALSTAWRSGCAAMGRQVGDFFQVGQPFDAIVYDLSHPLLQRAPAARRLSTLLYAFGSETLKATFVGGTMVVQNQRHRNWDQITRAFEALR